MCSRNEGMYEGWAAKLWETRAECERWKIKYRKIPKISPSMYEPQTGNVKNPPLNRPSKYKCPGGLYLENCPIRLGQCILKCRFSSIDKSLQKGLWKNNISPGAYFWNFMACVFFLSPPLLLFCHWFASFYLFAHRARLRGKKDDCLQSTSFYLSF